MQNTNISKNRNIPIFYDELIKTEIEKFLKCGIIQKSSSEWCSCIVPIIKPDKSLRLCIDYRSLNEKTVKDRYPIPRISDILNRIGGSKIFSTLDATSGFYQIELEEEDMHKTAFSYDNGFYEFRRMPFGLCNAPATFQRIMDRIFENDKSFVIPYLDDIIVFSKDLSEHERHLKIVFGRLKASNMQLNKKKCKLFKSEVKILGYIVTNGQVKNDPDKINAIVNYPKPINIKELRMFLGITGLSRNFIPGYASLASKLEAKLKGEVKKSKKLLIWNDELTESFKALKDAVKNNTLRSLPDFNEKFILYTDASDSAIGAVLAQKNGDSNYRMISAFSKKLDSAQKNYSITEKELLAIVKSCEYFRQYLIGKKFILKTDHKALTYLRTCTKPPSRLLRWALKLSEFDYTIEYIEGNLNVADGFSRMKDVFVNNMKVSRDMVTSDRDKNWLLWQYHNLLGHGSVNNMNYVLRMKYSWKGMAQDKKNFVNKCEICAMGSKELINTKNRVIETTNSNELWELDLVGRIFIKGVGNKFIFVAIDHYTKWVEAKVIEDKSAENIIESIQELIIRKHGIPQRILSDPGTEFLNDKIKKFCNYYNIKWSYSSPYHHNTVGGVERVIQTLMSKLRKISNFDESKLYICLNNAVFATNLSYNRAIGCSPYVLKYGKPPNFVFENKFNNNNQDRNKLTSFAGRDKHWNYYRKEIQKGKRSIKYDLLPGQKVWIFREPVKNKFSQGWFKGYKIFKREPPDAYIVTDGIKKLRVNKKHVKKYFEPLKGYVGMYIRN